MCVYVHCMQDRIAVLAFESFCSQLWTVGSLVHGDPLVHPRSHKLSSPTQVEVEADQVVLASLAEQHVGFDHQLSISKPRVGVPKFAEVRAGVDVNNVERKVKAIESLDVLLQQTLGIILSDLLACHISGELSLQPGKESPPSITGRSLVAPSLEAAVCCMSGKSVLLTAVCKSSEIVCLFATYL